GGAVSARFRETLRHMQGALWALSSIPIPAELAAEVQKARREMGLDLGGLEEYQSGPLAGRGGARVRAPLLWQARLPAPGPARVGGGRREGRERSAPGRQGTSGFPGGGWEYRMGRVEENKSGLGQGGKEPPPLEPGHSGWRLVPHAKVVDFNARKLVRDAQRR